MKKLIMAMGLSVLTLTGCGEMTHVEGVVQWMSHTPMSSATTVTPVISSDGTSVSTAVSSTVIPESFDIFVNGQDYEIDGSDFVKVSVGDTVSFDSSMFSYENFQVVKHH